MMNQRLVATPACAIQRVRTSQVSGPTGGVSDSVRLTGRRPARQAPQPEGRATRPALPASSPPNSGEWPVASKDDAHTRYSQLTDINTTNAARPGVAWRFPMGTMSGHEPAPLGVGGLEGRHPGRPIGSAAADRRREEHHGQRS